MVRHFRAAAYGLALFTLALSSSANAASTSVLNASLNADIRSLDPGVNRDANSDTVVSLIVEGLVANDKNGDPKPMLAQKVTVSPDGLAYVFDLRPGVHFQNGATLTAQDVVWNWNRYMTKSLAWRCYGDFSDKGVAAVSSVKVTGPLQVTFTLAHRSALFLSSLARPDCGMTGILAPQSVKADGSFDRPIGTGPYMLKAWTPGQSVDLATFSGYSARTDEGGPNGYVGDKTSKIAGIHFLIIPDASVAKAALQAGNIDVWSKVDATSAEQLKSVKGVVVSTSPTPAITGLLLQTRDPLMKDVRMRQALTYAIDFKQLVAGVTQGMGQPNASIVPAGSSYYGKVEATQYVYDPAKAQQLLHAAGYHGQPIKLIANTRYPDTYNAAVIVQAMLQAVGINAQLDVMEWGTQLNRYLSGDYTAMSFPYTPRFDPALTFDSIIGDKNKDPRKPWDDPQARAWTDEAMQTSDPATRQALFDKLQARFVADVPMIVLYNSMSITAYRSTVHGYAASIFNEPAFFGVSVDK